MEAKAARKHKSWAGSTDCYVYADNLPYIASILFTCVKFMWAQIKIMRQLIYL